MILETAVGWWLVINWKSSSSQLWAEAELWLRGFSLTTTFSDTGAFLRGLPFNYWYHQLLLGFWSYTDTVAGVTAAEKSTWVSEILFCWIWARWSCPPIWLSGFFGQREMISKRLSSERKWRKPFLLALGHVHNWVVWLIVFLNAFSSCSSVTCHLDCVKLTDVDFT